MPDDQDQRHVHQRVVQVDRALEPEARVALAVPQQEPGDGEEYLDAKLTVPDEGVHKLRRQAARVGNFCPEQAHVDVIHQDEEDGETAKKVNAIESCPTAGRPGLLR